MGTSEIEAQCYGFPDFKKTFQLGPQALWVTLKLRGNGKENWSLLTWHIFPKGF